jgi:hypothetical protein
MINQIVTASYHEILVIICQNYAATFPMTTSERIRFIVGTRFYCEL